MKIIDVHRIPRTGPFILACNHISLADPPLVGASVKRNLHYMAKKELFRNRLFGGLLGLLNSHPISRGGYDRGAINTAIDILNKGSGLLIFPEGTRAASGNFLPARRGIGLLATRCCVPVVPAYICGSNKLRSVFLGKTRLAVIFGEPLSRDEIAAYKDEEDGYRRLTDDIMHRILAIKQESVKRLGTN
jgi:1-acyl-sn-glycerol-3-phosphate acyltransferase